jgi:hypothetical protein
MHWKADSFFHCPDSIGRVARSLKFGQLSPKHPRGVRRPINLDRQVLLRELEKEESDRLPPAPPLLFRS